jgi:hypothetical protein
MTASPPTATPAQAGVRARPRREADPRPRRRGPTWRQLLWGSTPTAVLLDEADRLAEGRRWKEATRVLSAAAATVDGDEARRPVLERLAVTAADGGRHDVSREAVYELQGMETRGPATWVAFANVALARGNHLHADRAARSALDLAPDEHAAWAALAAGYAGLGWFDEADVCLDRLDRSALTARERWRIGRAVNRWALSGTGWFLVGALAAFLVGWLALAIAASAPLVARELRLRRLRRSRSGPALAAMAAEAWRSARRLRLGHGLAVSGSIAATVAAALAS